MNNLQIDNNNKKMWTKAINENVLLYPDEQIIKFLARNYKEREQNQNKKAIDIGFGSGRHIKALLDYNFETYGMDYNEKCIEVTKKVLGKYMNLKDLVNEDMSNNSFPQDYFDVVIIYGVIFLRKKEDMLKDLKHINMFMKCNGKMLINFRGKDNWFYGMGKSLDENTFTISKDGGPYENCTYTFLDKEQCEELLKEAGFEIENSERVDIWKNNCTEQHSWWVFTCRKV